MYNQFLQIPTQLKLQVINKCQPGAYSRLRRSCKFADEFCEKHQKSLGVYYDRNYVKLAVAGRNRTTLEFQVEQKTSSGIIYRRAIVDVRKSLSGIVIEILTLGENDGYIKDKSVNHAIETLPGIRMRYLNTLKLTSRQIKRALESTWNILYGVLCQYPAELVKIQSEDIVKKKNMYIRMVDDVMTAGDFAELVRWRENTTCLNATIFSSALSTLYTIIKNWERDKFVPQMLVMCWTDSEGFINRWIADFCSELGIKNAIYLGNILGNSSSHPFNVARYVNLDIWVRKIGKIWQIISLMRLSQVKEPLSGNVQIDFMKSDNNLTTNLARIIQEFTIQYRCCRIDFTAVDDFGMSYDLDKIKKCLDQILITKWTPSVME